MKVNKMGKSPSFFPRKCSASRSCSYQRTFKKQSIYELTGISRNTTSKYLHGAEPVIQRRNAKTQWLQNNKEQLWEAFFKSGYSCAVVQRNLKEKCVQIRSRQLQRFSEPLRLERKAVKKYCRRYETSPGDHMQIAFCEKSVEVGGQTVKIHVFVAILAFSRRIFAKVYPAENQAAWLDGIESAFFYFKARPRSFVCDNTRCLVRAHRRRGETEWTLRDLLQLLSVKAIVCSPYHPQGKGKVERAVRYVQGNALQCREFDSLQSLNQWLEH